MSKEQFNQSSFAKDGTIFSTPQEAREYDYQRRLKYSEKLERPITDGEWSRGYVRAATDSRTPEQKMADAKYSHKKRQSLSPDESLLAETEARMDRGPDLKKMSSDEVIAFTLRQRIDREQSQKLAVETRAAHLENVVPTLAKLDNLIESENWSESSDEKFRVQLQHARAALVDPEADPVEVKRLLKTVDDVTLERNALKAAEAMQARAAADAVIAAVDAEFGLLEPDKPEHTLDPTGYDDPMQGYKPEPAPSIFKVEVNKNQKPFDVAYDLQEAMEASGSFTDSQVTEVRNAALSGDEAAIQSVVNQFAV